RQRGGVGGVLQVRLAVDQVAQIDRVGHHGQDGDQQERRERGDDAAAPVGSGRRTLHGTGPSSARGGGGGNCPLSARLSHPYDCFRLQGRAGQEIHDGPGHVAVGDCDLDRDLVVGDGRRGIDTAVPVDGDGEDLARGRDVVVAEDVVDVTGDG